MVMEHVAEGRALQEFDCTAQRLHNVPVREPGGRLVDDWVPDGTDPIPARLSPVASTEPIVQGRPEIRSTAYIVLPWNEDIADDARVRITHNVRGWVRTFAIIGRHAPRSNQIVTKLVGEEVL